LQKPATNLQQTCKTCGKAGEPCGKAGKSYGKAGESCGRAGRETYKNETKNAFQ
jgi:hypothetical protein